MPATCHPLRLDNEDGMHGGGTGGRLSDLNHLKSLDPAVARRGAKLIASWYRTCDACVFDCRLIPHDAWRCDECDCNYCDECALVCAPASGTAAAAAAAAAVANGDERCAKRAKLEREQYAPNIFCLW